PTPPTLILKVLCMPRAGPSEPRLTEIGRAAIESRFLGIAVWDAEGRIVEVNDTLAQLLGSTPAELSRRAWPDLTPERYRPLDLRAAAALREHSRFAPYEK